MHTKLLLELGCNHQGDIKIAKEMIDAAAGLGAWGVKLQKRDLDSMPEHLKFLPRNPDTSFGKNYYEHRAALEFDNQEMIHLFKYIKEKKLVPVVSVFDEKSLIGMVFCGFSDIKLPSQLYSNYAINNALFCNVMVNSYVSTGMHSLNEITNWQYFDKATYTMYCRSLYPCELSDINFKQAQELRAKLNKSKFGYSSHDTEGKAIPFFIIMGAEIIERHFTLNKKMKGSDHKISSDEKETREIIEKIEEIEDILKCDFSYIEKENKIKKVYRSPY